MATTETACRICAGDLSLRVVGTNGHAPVAEAFSPSPHEPGRHGDLLACLECGTVQQPVLPAGDAAARALPRDARRRLPGRGGRPARDREPPARPDRRARRRRAPARRRLRPRPAARRGAPARLRDGRAGALARGGAPRARGARASTSASCRSRPSPSARRLPGFDVVVLADVLEHLDDPVAAIDRCARLLRPGGVLCVVTPDPSSLTARLAGARWWGYLPAHTVLLPRRTLRELIAAARAGDLRRRPVRAHVRGAALGRRAGRAAGAAARAARARWPARCRRASLSLSLGDERVILAHRTPVRHAAAAAAARPRRPAHGARRAARPTRRRARSRTSSAEMPVEAADRALLIDDARRTRRPRSRSQHGLDVLRHPANRGYGAARRRATCARCATAPRWS